MAKIRIAKQARELAILCLELVEHKQLLVPEALEAIPHRLDSRDIGLAVEITYGTLRFLPGLDGLLLEYVDRFEKLPPRCRWLLLSSAYQILMMRVPDYAVLNESNQLARALGFAGLRRLVNGVLRRLTREGAVRWQGLDAVQRVLPQWMREPLAARFGEQGLSDVASSWCERPLQAFWSPGGSDLGHQSEWLAHARLGSELGSDLLQDGYAQNESSQAICELARALSATRILDLCAAPGGKSLYLAAFDSDLEVVATDRVPSRLARLRDNAARLGLEQRVKVVEWDRLDGSLDFDLVLLDAPCSAIGIAGRHPEIKVHRRGLADEARLDTQSELVERAGSLIKPGGHILYAVCSWDLREVPTLGDGLVVEADVIAEWARELPFVELREWGFQIRPGNRFDGFCGALWRDVSTPSERLD